MKKIISFPQIGNYGIPIKCFLEKITKCKVILPPKINNSTKISGSKHSPDYVCSPFKFNIGNYIESLNAGANILIQAGGGCRYGYYAELQEKILKDLGYEFEFINLIKNNKVSGFKLYKFAKKNNKNLNIFYFLHSLIVCSIKVLLMDKIENFIRIKKYKYISKMKIDDYYNYFLKDLSKFNSIHNVLISYLKYNKNIKKLKTIKDKPKYKVAIVGELFTLMENQANSNIEKKLIEQNISIYRYTNFTYLLIKKKIKLPFMIKSTRKYLKYHLGADGTSSVFFSKKCAEKKFDGIIHIKSFGCTPEINAMPILNNISKDYNIPFIYFSFDILDNEINVDNRIEAFCEMIKMKKEN